MLTAFAALSTFPALISLSACSGYREPPKADTDTAADSATTSGTIAPTLSERLGDCGGAFRDPGPYPNQLSEGEDLHRVTLDSPTALCNDGTQAVIYVRPGSGEDIDRWSIHLQGGASCTTYEECAARWCGDEFYDASKMSSQWAPEAVAGDGITSLDPENPFAAWSHAYFYYCSSDVWTGQSEATVRSQAGEDMRLQRRGHEILAAGIEALRRSPVSDDSDVIMPDLDDAEFVLLSGTSAGSSGAQHHADWLAAQFPAIPVRAAFDAAVTPAPATVDPAAQASIDAYHQANAEQRLADEPVAPFADESCLQYQGASADTWRCYTANHALYNHVTTPFFARMDLYDSQTIESYTAMGLTSDEFALAVQSSLASLATLPDTATEGASIAVIPGAYGPACGQHVGLEASEWTFVSTLDGHTLADSLAYWLTGSPVSLIDTLPPTLSTCP